MGELGDLAALFHVGSVAAGAEDTSNLHLGVSVRGGDERAGGVVNESCQDNWDFLEKEACQ